MSTKSLGTLTLDLIVQTGGFESGMDRAARAADYKTKQMERQTLERTKAIEGALSNMARAWAAPLAGAAIGLSGIASLNALKGKILEAIEGMAGLKEAAEKTGASVEKLSALKGVAKIGGRDFADIETSIIKLNKALHGTDDESAGAGKALAALGLSVKELRAIDPADAMLALAKAQAEFTDGGGKSAAMMAILGKNGAALIPYLHDLAEQGSLVGKVTKEQAIAADEYEKNIKRLQASWGALSRQMAAAAAGPLKDITDWMLVAQKQGGTLYALFTGLGAAVNKAFGGEINRTKVAENEVNDYFDKLTKEKKYLEELKATRFDKGSFFGAFDDMKIAASENRIATLNKNLKSAIKTRNKLLNAEDEATTPKSNALDNQTFGKDSKTREGFDGMFKSLAEKIAASKIELSVGVDVSAAQKDYAKFLVDVKGGLVDLTPAQVAQLDAMHKQNIAIQEQIKLYKDFDTQSAEYERHRLDVKNAQEGMTNATRERIQAIRDEVAALGMSDEARTRMIEMRRIDNEAAKLGIKATEMEAAAYRDLAAALKTDLGAAMDDAAAKKKAYESDWTNGMTEAIRKYGENSGKVATATEQAFTSAFGRMEDAIVDFCMGGKTSFADFAKSVVAGLIRIQVQESMTRILKEASGWLSGLFGGGSAAGVESGAEVFTSAFGFAKGGVFNSPSLSAYSGQVVSKPTMFAFASGAGLMGEAGPEAIMPLKRGADGKLGVAGGGNAAPVSISVVINNNGDATTETQGDQQGAWRQMADRVRGVVLEEMVRQKRPGGVLYA